MVLLKPKLLAHCFMTRARMLVDAGELNISANASAMRWQILYRAARIRRSSRSQSGASLNASAHAEVYADFVPHGLAACHPALGHDPLVSEFI